MSFALVCPQASCARYLGLLYALVACVLTTFTYVLGQERSERLTACLLFGKMTRAQGIGCFPKSIYVYVIYAMGAYTRAMASLDAPPTPPTPCKPHSLPWPRFSIILCHYVFMCFAPSFLRSPGARVARIR